MNRLSLALLLVSMATACGASELSADSIRFRNYDVTNGLPHSNVRAIVQDADGYVWFGTQNGLARFDGTSFRTFRHARDDRHSLPDNHVMALAADPDGAVWIGTATGGLARYDPALERFESWSASVEEGGNRCTQVRALQFTSGGRLLVSCFGVGVRGFDRASLRFETLPFGTPESLRGVRVILERRSGALLLASEELWQWDPRAPDLTPLLREFGPVVRLHPHALLEDTRGDLWVGLIDQGVLRLRSDGSLVAGYRADVLGGDRIRGLLESRDGTIWIANDAGIAIYSREDDRFSRRPTDPDDPTGPPLEPGRMLEDRDGLVWLGSWRGGVGLHDPDTRAVRLYRQRTDGLGGLPRTPVTAVLANDDGSLWLGLGDGGGLARFQPGHGISAHYLSSANPSSIADDYISAIAPASDGGLWIAMATQGLDRLSADGMSFRHFRGDLNDIDALPGDLIDALHVDAQGTLWIAMDGGGLVSRCARCDTFTRELDATDMPSGLVTSIAGDQDGVLWLGLLGGAVRFDPRTRALSAIRADPSNPDALSHAYVQSNLVDRSGTVWFGTGGGGVDRVEGIAAEGSVRFSSHAGDNDTQIDVVTCMRDDAEGRLWLGTATGLRRFEPTTGNVEPFVVLGRADVHGYRPGACARIGETLYFGGLHGLLAFDPAQLPRERHVGPVHLTDLTLFNRPVRPEPDAPDAVLKRSIGRTQALTLGPQRSVFGFAFAAIDFRDPLSVRYRYRLDDLHDDWLPLPSGQGLVGFSALPAGSYVFRVEAARGESRSETRIALTVLPPWWESGVARFGYWLLGFALLATLAWRVRARLRYERHVAATIRTSETALRRLNEELEQRVEARTCDLKGANDELRVAFANLKEAQHQLIEAEKMASLGGLVAGVAHEINTPVGVSVTAASHLETESQRFAALAGRGALTPGALETYASLARDSSALILRNLQRADRLVKSFKQLAVDQSSEARRRISLCAYLEESLLSLQPMYQRSPHRVELECADMPELETYPGALYQILLNLVTNSMTHGFDGVPAGRVVIAAHRERNEIVLQYRDDGRGMNDEVKRHVFEPFFTTRRGQGGTGLGMHIVWNLVTQLLRGRIDLQSAPGEGVRFEIRFPAAPT